MPPPRGGGALLRNLSDNYAHSSASQAGQNATQKGATNLTPQEQLLNGTLELDPENDPVVWVTDNGFEIKSHDVSVSSGTTTVSSTSWKYITLGSWNWIIIGYSTKNETQGIGHVSVATPDNYDRNTYTTWLDGATPKLAPDSTDAGAAIKSAVQTQSTNFYNTSSFTYKLKSVFTNAAADPKNEIPAGCVLCLCDTIFSVPKDSTGYYPTSNHYSVITTVYDTIKEEANNQIQETELTTWYYNGSAIDDYSHQEFLFPLATTYNWAATSYPQNFCIETYLNTNAKRNLNGKWWWLRSGFKDSQYASYAVAYDGAVGDLGRLPIRTYPGARPAFVLKLI
ncbi:MAG: hypothetical protein J6A98_02540 [Clostridia bacterium]|nr:hypothetical protein [Clostridia bacterium]